MTGVTEQSVQAAVLSLQEDYLYFGAEEGWIIKYSTSNFSEVGRFLTTDANGEAVRSLRAAVISANGEYVYFAGYSKIARIATNFSTNADVLITSGGLYWGTAVDSSNHYAYFGGSETIDKVSLENFTIIDTLDVNGLKSFGAISPSGEYAYFAAQYMGIKTIALNNFSVIHTFTHENMDFFSGVISPSGDFLYVGIYGGAILKLHLDPIPTLFDIISFPEHQQKYLHSAVISPFGDFAYFGTWGLGLATILKIELSELDLNDSISVQGVNVFEGIITQYGDYAYFTLSDSSRPSIYKIFLQNTSHLITTGATTGASTGATTAVTTGVTTGVTSDETTTGATTAIGVTTGTTEVQLTTETSSTQALGTTAATSGDHSPFEVSSSGDNIALILAVVFPVTAVVLIIVGILLVIILRKRRKDSPNSTELELDSLTIDDITIECKLGEGNFADVYRGNWRGTAVALKLLKDANQFKEFYREAKMLQQLNHPHIVRYLGIHKDVNSKVYIVTEFMSKGSLATVIQNEPNLTTDDLLRIAKQAAFGMSYLEANKVIHRDIGLRNFLVKSEDDEPYFVKVSDFGLSRSMDSDYYKARENLIPIRWTAPEALQFRKFSTKSDVWSFGIMLWELFTRGMKPYYEFSNQEVAEKVVGGYRLQPPQDAPTEVKEIMQKCWELNPDSRPSFKKILQTMEDLICPKLSATVHQDLNGTTEDDNYQTIESNNSRSHEQSIYVKTDIDD